MSEKGKRNIKKPERENVEMEIPKRECKPLELLEDLALIHNKVWN
jgi:hypothetical protein